MAFSSFAAPVTDADSVFNRMAREIVDLQSALAAVLLTRRTTANGSTPAVIVKRIKDLGLGMAVREHLQRLEAEPDFDQEFAISTIIEKLLDDVPLQLLSGPAGTGKTEVVKQLVRELPHQVGDDWCLHQFKKKAADLVVGVLVPTNKAKSILESRGVEASTIHAAIYAPAYKAEEIAALWEFILSSGKTGLPQTINGRVAVIMANASEGAKERAAKVLPGSARGIDPITQAKLLEKALHKLGVAEGLMSILRPQWQSKGEPIADIIICDEASMVTSLMLEDVMALAKFVILVGDVFQLPPVIDAEDRLAGARPAISMVPLCDQAHLYRDRRVVGESEHLTAANWILRVGSTVEGLEAFARSGAKGVSYAPAYDVDLMTTASALAYFRNSVVRIGVSARQALGLPSDRLVPGERILLESIPKDLREQLSARSLGKNVRVVVVDGDRSGYRVIAEDKLERLTAEIADPTKLAEAVIAEAVNLRFNVSYLRDELQQAGVRLDEDIANGGLQLAVGIPQLSAKLGYSSTVHKSQGASFDIVQIALDDLYGVARSSYGQAIEDGIPVPMWQRLAYTAITRARRGVVFVRERAYRGTIGAKLQNIPDESALESCLPPALRGRRHAGALDDLSGLLGDLPGDDDDAKAADDSAKVIAFPGTPAPQEVKTEPSRLSAEAVATISATLAKTPRNGTLRLRTGVEGRTVELTRRDEYIVVRFSGQSMWQQLSADGSVKGLPGRNNDGDIELIERAVRTLRETPADAFKGLTVCGACGRALTDPTSRKLGIGPVCAAKLGVAFECAPEPPPVSDDEW